MPLTDRGAVLVGPALKRRTPANTVSARCLLAFGVDLKAIVELALNLPVDERARLVRQLLESLDTPRTGEVEPLWREEAARRADQIDRGEVTLVSADEVLAKARALLE